VLGVEYWHWLDSVLALAYSDVLQGGASSWKPEFRLEEERQSSLAAGFNFQRQQIIGTCPTQINGCDGMPRRAAACAKRNPE
jgi:hypothetical protein